MPELTPKVVDVWIAYVKKLFQESGQCGHVSKNFSNRPWNHTSKKELAKRGSHEEGHKTGGGKWAEVHYCFWSWFGVWCDASFIHCLQMQASL